MGAIFLGDSPHGWRYSWEFRSGKANILRDSPPFSEGANLLGRGVGENPVIPVTDEKIETLRCRTAKRRRRPKQIHSNKIL